MACGRGIYMCDRPEPCYEYGKMIILSRVLCDDGGDILMVPKPTASVFSFINTYVIGNVDKILPYCVITKNHKRNYMSASAAFYGGLSGGLG